MTTDLSALTAAADKWDAMATEFKKAERAYKKDVHGITLGQSWSGLSADAANNRFTATLKEYKSAQTEAKAVASLIRDAHTQFVDLRAKVKAAVAEAVGAGMTVSDQGKARFDYSKATEQERFAAHHDPGLRDAEQSWTDHIAGAVRAVGDADDGFALALKAAMQDSDPFDGTIGGFNSRATGDIEKYEAEAAADTAMKLNSGEKVSERELAGLERALRDNSGNKEFSQPFLKALGAGGSIRLSNKLFEIAYAGEKSGRKQLLQAQRELGNTVASATQKSSNDQDRAFYEEFTKDLKENGTKNFDSESNPNTGYSTFVSMMNMADDKFNQDFLYGLGDDLIAAEKNDHDLFAQKGAGHNGIRADAIDTLLGVMSRDPDVATTFLDPGQDPEKGNRRLEYLTGTGDDSRDWPKILLTGYPRVEIDDPYSHTGLGAALEAAATGHTPLAEGDSNGHPGPHTPAQARVMQGAIEYLDSGAAGDTVPKHMHQNLANAMADYAADNHNILAETDGPRYGSPAGRDGIWQDGSGQDAKAGITVGKDSLMRVMRGVTEEADTANLLYATQRDYAMERLVDAPAQGGEGHVRWTNPANDLGHVMGAMNSIGSDVILDERDGKIAQVNDETRYGYHVIGAPITGLPVLGDAAQRMVDAAGYEWSKDVSEAAEAAAVEKNSGHYSSGINGTYELIDAWAKDRGVDIEDHENAKHDPDWDAWRDMRTRAKQSYTSARSDAATYLGWE
ncbi:hypothetical protein ACFV8E_29650 [Streptomyces sp. NPDC059849]|uniref:hypothetical protein n=1 Tax=Streptomyces sp. NPDC059849 TaxID=3346969 RepID=UPI0036500947